MIDKFLGSWHISHYVYDAYGKYIGMMREQRSLDSTAEGKLRVISRCEPEAALAGYPVEHLAGEWVYEIDPSDDQPNPPLQRGYPIQGNQVVGKRLNWGWNTFTEHGQWGEFTFTAFGALITPQRQIISTILEPPNTRKITFDPHTNTQAKMIGIAVSSEAGDWEAFSGAQKPEEVAELWRGAWQSFNVDGELEAIKWVERRYIQNGWEEFAEGELSDHVFGGENVKSLILTKDAPRQFRRYGWALEFLAGSFIDFSTEQIEILDNATQTLIALRRTTYYGNAPLFESRIELAFLKPIE